MRPALHFALREDGQIERVGPWYPLVDFTVELLRERSKFLRVDGDAVEIRCTNGGAEYALGPATGGVRRGTLVRHWASC